MTFSHALSTNNYGPAKFIVATSAANGTHTTLASAMAAASVGDTIILRDSVTENVTITPGVNISGWNADILNTASITGTLTMTGAGTSTISNLTLITNSAAVIAVTGSAASILNVNNCFLKMTNNTGITLSSSSASSQIYFTDCKGDLTTTGIAIFAHSGAGFIRMYGCLFQNNGASSTANTISGTGFFFPNFSGWSNPITMSSSSVISGSHNQFVMAGNLTSLTMSNTSNGVLQWCNFTSNTATAITLNVGTSLQLHDCNVSSSNATTISGAGTLLFTHISGNSVLALDAALTLSNGAMKNFISGGGVGTAGQVYTSNGVLSPPTWQGAGWVLLSTQTASTSANLEFINLTSFNTYVFVIKNIKAATNAQPLEMTVSGDNGSSYANSGYTGGLAYFPFNLATPVNFNATTYAPIASNSTTGDGVDGIVYCIPNNGRYWGMSTYGSNDTGNTVTSTLGGGTGVVFNGFKFLFASGNITSGTISLYGINS